MDQAITSEPKFAFSAEGNVHNTSQQRLASLSREAVCTENLTPWIKLLPCQQKAGLSSLLNAYKIFDGNYHSISVHFTRICVDHTCHYQLKQTLSVVFDPLRTHNSKDWSISSLFDHSMRHLCPFSTDTVIKVNFSEKSGYHVFIPINFKDDNGNYHLSKAGLSQLTIILDLPFRTSVKWLNKNVDYSVPTKSKVRTHRFLGGVGDASGSIIVDFINDEDQYVNINYFESVPWILKYCINIS